MKKNILYLLLLIAVAATAYWFSQKNIDNTMADNPLTDFQVADTASIYKIFIADQNGQSVTMERNEGEFWSLNNKYKVRAHSVQLLLETFANAGVQTAVPKNFRETVIRNMASTQRKVMLFDKENEWIKTWYLGNPTKTNQGTYAILETPEHGLSSEPFVLEKRGFRGYLTSRFHTTVKDWRWRGVFYYPEMDIKSIEVIRPKEPEKGFKLTVNDIKTNDLELMDHNGESVKANLASLQLYLLKYKEVYLETFDPPLLDDAQEDSVAARVPDFRLNVKNHAGESTLIDLQYKRSLDNMRELDPLIPEIDPDRMFGSFNGELIQIQRHNFDEMLIDKAQLLK